ncbi:MAG: AAA family ATPase [Candidatus Eisenbacteria bacterium]|nr:AAA family ATPase [Candidatus Eisenbacteria bacterium]
MYVDRIELYGFKSFMNRTDIPLSRGITAIVGPNGCGKSNISDAMRWILGEQNARVIRGEKLEDVIFKGSGLHKAMGMCEVSLIVHNDDGRLPTEYTQVQISRRVFRSGESEFQINKVPCRLKDIKDLFAGTGLGSSGYAMIERDQVDQVLSDKDDARRLLFEEASGIIRYKARRKETERKLEATEGDLVRIEDMIREIEREVRSLARQAGKVRRWRRLKEELDRHEIRAAHERWTRLREESRSSEALYKQKDAQRQDLLSVVAVKDAKREMERQQSLDLAERLEAAQRALGEAERSLASAHEEIRVLSTRNESWNQEEIELKRQSERHEERLRDLATEGAEIEPEIQDWVARLEHAREATQTALRLRGEAEKQVREVRALVNEAQQLNLGLFTTHGETKKELEATERRREAAINRLNGLRQHLEAFSGRGNQAEWFLGEARAQIDAVGTEREESESVREEVAQELDRVRNERSDCRERVGEAERKRTGLESRLGVLEEQHARHAGFDAAVRWVLENRADLTGMVGVVGEMVRVRTSAAGTTGAHETEARSILSECVPWILVQDEGAAIELIARLRERGLGGVTFFPLAEAGVAPTPGVGFSSPEEREIAALFDADDAALPFVRFLARRSRIAADLSSALTLARQNQSTSQGATSEGAAAVERIVTPDGELVGPSGLVRLLGGESEEAEIVRREAEMPVLAGRLDEVSALEEQLRAQESQLQRREQELAARLKATDETLSRLEKVRAEAMLKQGSLETELAMLNEERARIETETDALEEEIAELITESERLTAVVARSGEDTAGAQLRFEELRERAEAAEEARDQRVREASEREMEQVRLENQLRGAEGRLRALEREADERRIALREIQARIETRTREAEESNERIEELRLVLTLTDQERGLADRAVAEVRQAHLECQERLGTIDAELRSERAQLDQVTNELHAGDLGRLQTQAEAEQIRARILEEHKIDLEEWTGFTVSADAVANADLLSEEEGDGEEPVVGLEAGEAGPDARLEGELNPAASEGSPAESVVTEGPEVAAGDQPLSTRARRRLEEELAAEAALAPEERATRMAELRRRLQEMGNLNFLAEEEYKTQKERLDFHQGHANDLRTARADLIELIRQINEKASEMFAETFTQVQAHFVDTYQKLFPGGEASLRLVGTDPLEGDIEISARPRGKKVESIRLLSSGERSLSAIALLFAIYLAKPSPICLLDEVDAPLDDANLERFLALVKHFSERTQFIMITHNKKTMAAAGRLFGVTMEEPGVSKIVSVRLNEGRVEVAAGAETGVAAAGTREFSLGPGTAGTA